VAKKRSGQHFLSDSNILRRIVQFAEIRQTDTVVEIGPGRGALTRALAEAAKQVIAIEIDRDLIATLQKETPSNVTILHADALQADFAALSSGSFRIVGNLPYNVATPLFKRFIQFRSHITDVTVMIQKEVADRILAAADDDAYGPLSVLIQYYAIPVFGFVVRPGSFRPKPKVDSAVIRLEWRAEVKDDTAFTDFVHNVFGSRRKKLVNNILNVFPHISRAQILSQLADSGIPADARPENLSVDDFHRLYNRTRRH